MAFKVLIPYNFTLNDEKALEYAGRRYRQDEGIEITLFHAYPHLPEIDVKHDPIMGKLISNVSYLRSQREEHKAALEAAKAKLEEYGFDGSQIHTLFRPVRSDVAEDIIQLWKQEKFNVIVLNRSPGSIMNYFSRSISKRIQGFGDGRIHIHVVN